MTKEAFVQQELEKAQKREAPAKRIQALYVKYLNGGDPYDLEDLLKESTAFSQNRVQHVLSQSAHYSASDIPDALQEGSLAVAKAVEKHRAQGTCIEGFAWFAKTIYRNQAVELVRTQYRLNGQFAPVSLNRENDEGKEFEFLGQDDIPSAEEDELELDRQQLSRRLLLMYCDTLLRHDSDPQKPLGVCYARVLYQVESWCQDGRETHTASSVKWAWKRMGGKTLVQLGIESQKSIQKYLHPKLKWCKPFLTKLREASPYSDGTPWKDLVYTNEFTYAQTSNWVEWIHKTVFDRVRKQIQADAELLEAAKTLNNPFKKTLNEMEASK